MIEFAEIDPLRKRIEKEHKRSNVSWNVIEQDYAISWILTGIVNNKILYENLIFKGGTALKKCYFGNYRFSQDIDFTAINSSSIDFEKELNKSCTFIADLMEKYIPRPNITCKRYLEKQPHPSGQEAYTIAIQLPWHREPLAKSMVEITKAEKILTPWVNKQVIHGYGENIQSSIQVYSITEIVIEKLRAILQFSEKLHERGWARSRSRDYYDLWQILEKYPEQVDTKNFLSLLRAKCAVKKISFTNHEDFFKPEVLIAVEETWLLWLQPLTADLPGYFEIINDLKNKIALLINE